MAIAQTISLQPPDKHELDKIKYEICAAAKRNLETIFRIGELLTRAKSIQTRHGEFTAWVNMNLPFRIRDAERYMAIFKHLSLHFRKTSYMTFFNIGLADWDEIVRVVRRAPDEQSVVSILRQIEQANWDGSDIKATISTLKATYNKAKDAKNAPISANHVAKRPPKNVADAEVQISKNIHGALKSLGVFNAIFADLREESKPDYASLYTQLKAHLAPGGFLVVRIPNKIEIVGNACALFGADIRIGVKSDYMEHSFDEGYEVYIMNQNAEKPESPRDENIVTHYVIEGGRVLDLFWDSAKNGVDCVKSKRMFVGFVKTPQTRDEVRRRIYEATKYMIFKERIEMLDKVQNIRSREKPLVVSAYNRLTRGEPGGDIYIQGKLVTINSIEELYEYFRTHKLECLPLIERDNIYPEIFINNLLAAYYDDDRQKENIRAELVRLAHRKTNGKHSHLLPTEMLSKLAREALGLLD